MQPIERGMDKYVARGARLEGRCQANVAEPHGSDSSENRPPGTERAGNQRMEMIDIHRNRIVMN
jgi:hypothetical protein